MDLRAKPGCEKERQQLRAPDIENSLTLSDVEVLQDVSGLDTAHVLDRQREALETSNGCRGQCAGTDPEPEQVKIPVRVGGGAQGSPILGAANLAASIEDHSDQTAHAPRGERRSAADREDHPSGGAP